MQTIQQKGELAIVNAVGGMGKIYCILKVPIKNSSSGRKKVEFMIGADKGDKYVVKDLRLFSGYRLYTMPESQKGKDTMREGITTIPNDFGSAGDTFQMEDGIIVNVGVGLVEK